MLEIVSHWVETLPEFLFPSKLSEKWSELPMLRSKQPTLHSKSPLPGLMQWCVLAPLVPKEQVLCCGSTKDSQKLLVTSNSDMAPGFNRSSEISSQREDKFGSLMAKLHANILSVILSHSQSFGYRSLSSDDIAVVIATLLAFSQQLSQSRSRGGGTGNGGDVLCGMTESVERLAQFLQIMLSCGILALNAGTSIYCTVCSFLWFSNTT